MVIRYKPCGKATAKTRQAKCVRTKYVWYYS